LKLHRHILLPALFLLGFSLSALASPGDPPFSLVVSTEAKSDTTDPKLTFSADTTEPAIVADVVAKLDSNETDPPSKTPAPADTSAEEDGFASDFYTDFDTTSVHSEKFDVLNFNDSVLIVLNGPEVGEYCHPFKGNATSAFGFRKYRYHLGEDVDLETGDSVHTCFNGKVRIAQWSKTYGNVVVVRHPNGIETYYAHLSKLMVKTGDDVKAGDLIGLGGNTGHSHGSHLHFETRFKGQPFDPNMIIDFDNMCLRGDTYYLSKSNFKYMSEVHKVKHYSKKKKKTWYTYYNAGGPEYATAAAKENMNSVADPLPATGITPPAPVNAPQDSLAPKVTPKVQPKVEPKPKTATPNNTTSAKSGSTYYTVKKGDTLGAIAARNGTTVDKLCKLNGIKSTSILQIGQKIKLK
jgi:murein DD-endopeptidase MepM/ murein hydrolase activator NlpD